MLLRLAALSLLPLASPAYAHGPGGHTDAVVLPEPEPEPEPPKLTAEARVGLGAGPGRKIRITNPTDSAWNHCDVTLKGLFAASYSYTWETIPAGEFVRTRSGNFVSPVDVNFDSNNEIVRIIIECDEGRASIWPNPPKK